METAIDLGWLITAVFIPILWMLSRKINEVIKDLSDYKLSAERRFASVGHLQEVEKRLAAEMKGLREDVKELTRAVNMSLRTHGNGD